MRIENENKIKIQFIRHGKTLLNERHCYIGSTNESLSNTGILEITKNINEGIYEKVERVFSSPMARAKESAKLIYPNMNTTIVDELRETDFGSFEGKSYNDLKDNILYRRWIDEARGVSEQELQELYPNINDVYDEIEIKLPESGDTVLERVLVGFKKIIFSLKEESTIAIVAHGGTIQSLFSYFLRDNLYNYMISPAGVITAEVSYYRDNITSYEDITISRFVIINRICS